MRIFFSIALLGVLGACASLTEEQCQAGNWHSIGYTDGANGRLPGYISRHVDACGKIGIAPDFEAWQAGRTQGLPLYCTAENAYNVGRNGRDLSPVCPAAQMNTLNRFWDWGLAYHQTTEEIDELERDANAINREILAALAITPSTPESAALVSRLQRELRSVRRQILRLEREKRRYSQPPY